jgi:hypothetical protein
MTIQLLDGHTHLAEKAHRFEHALTGLNARIVFLAGLVGAKLDTAGEVQRILDRNNPGLRARPFIAPGHAGAHAHLVLPRAWEELRGLMVLRYQLVTRALDALGLSLTHHIASRVEQGLERKGIKCGADGFDLHLQMGDMVERLGTPGTLSTMAQAAPLFVTAEVIAQA